MPPHLRNEVATDRPFLPVRVSRLPQRGGDPLRGCEPPKVGPFLNSSYVYSSAKTVVNRIVTQICIAAYLCIMHACDPDSTRWHPARLFHQAGNINDAAFADDLLLGIPIFQSKRFLCQRLVELGATAATYVGIVMPIPSATRRVPHIDQESTFWISDSLV